MQQQNQNSITIAKFEGQTYEQLLSQGIDPLHAEIILGNLSDSQLENFIQNSRSDQNVAVPQIIKLLAQSKIYTYSQLLQIDKKKCGEFKIDSMKLNQAKQSSYRDRGEEDYYPIYDVKPRTIQSDQKYKSVLLLGQTGAGKSTFINLLANYCYCKNQNVQYRVRAIKNEQKKKQSESCTEKIYIYVFINRRTNEQLVLIDTPGFGDTGGFDVDLKITKELQSLLTNKLNQIDMICLIKKEQDNRLDVTNLYVLGKVFSLFANDVKKNVHLIFTNSQFSKNPQALNLFIDDKEFQNILSSMIEPKYSQVEMGSEALFDKDNEYIVKLGKNFDRINKLWEKFIQMPPQSLLLTQQVLIDRQNLIKLADDLSNQLIDQLNELDYIQKNYNNIQGSRYNSVLIKRFIRQIIKLKPGEFVTNCIVCRQTCHYPCFIEKDHLKFNCSAMKNFDCSQCLKKCHWIFHKNNNYRIIYSMRTQLVTLFSEDNDKLIQKYMENIQSYCKKYIDFVYCLEKIKQNAMLPGSLLYLNDYLLLQIQNEEQQKQDGYKERITQLNSILRLNKKIQSEHNQLTGEQTLNQLLQPLQHLIDLDAFKAVLEVNKLNQLQDQ